MHNINHEIAYISDHKKWTTFDLYLLFKDYYALHTEIDACHCHSITNCTNVLMSYFRSWQLDHGLICTLIFQRSGSWIICSLWVFLYCGFIAVDRKIQFSYSTIFWQEILESFRDPEFWYVEQGIAAPDCDGSASFRTAFHRRDEKWWLPVPRVPPGGLHNKTRKQLQHKRDCANQILKAAMAINSNALAEMEVPESYLDSLPKVYHAFFCNQNSWMRNVHSIS